MMDSFSSSFKGAFERVLIPPDAKSNKNTSDDHLGNASIESDTESEYDDYANSDIILENNQSFDRKDS